MSAHTAMCTLDRTDDTMVNETIILGGENQKKKDELTPVSKTAEVDQSCVPHPDAGQQHHNGVPVRTFVLRQCALAQTVNSQQVLFISRVFRLVAICPLFLKIAVTRGGAG